MFNKEEEWERIAVMTGIPKFERKKRKKGRKNNTQEPKLASLHVRGWAISLGVLFFSRMANFCFRLNKTNVFWIARIIWVENEVTKMFVSSFKILFLVLALNLCVLCYVLTFNLNRWLKFFKTYNTGEKSSRELYNF